MEKPVTMLISEFRKKLIETVNSSKLHIILTKQIVEEVTLALQEEYNRLEVQELTEYNKRLEKQNKEKEKK